jgi:hypothetical protein
LELFDNVQEFDWFKEVASQNTFLGNRVLQIKFQLSLLRSPYTDLWDNMLVVVSGVYIWCSDGWRWLCFVLKKV